MATHAHSPQGTPRPRQSAVVKSLRLQYIPMWLEGGLNPALTMEQKGQLFTACAARFAYIFQHHKEVQQVLADLQLTAEELPASDADLAGLLKLNPDEYQEFRLLWPAFKLICVGTADGMLERENNKKDADEPHQSTQPIRRGKI